MRILGISAYYHDSAAALIEDGEVLFAAQEERFTRKKHDAAFPHKAIEACMRHLGVTPAELSKQVDWVVFYDKPFLKFERLLKTYLAFAPRGFASFRKSMPLWISEKVLQKGLLADALGELDPSIDWIDRLLFSEHHLSHAASAFYPSPFRESAVVTMDGVGEWSTSSISFGKGSELELLREMTFPHSLGLLYSAFTYFTGFKVNSGEYKLMGLAPYGEAKFKEIILRELVDLKADGSLRLNQKYFDYCAGLKMTNERFSQLFGVAPRAPEDELKQVHMDLAASVQVVTEEAMLKTVAHASAVTGSKNICLAGGVALNCVANGRLLREAKVDGLWIQPAAGDAGGALGAALSAYHLHFKRERVGGGDHMRGAYLGPSYAQSDIEQSLRVCGAKFETLSEDAMLLASAKDLAAGKALGWFQGRMEFGPRALGGRSILADPRAEAMQKNLNLKVKFRESFRPFAPAVRREDLAEWFNLDADSPYMMLVADVAKAKLVDVPQSRAFGIDRLNERRSEIPAVTHVDNSARVQTVHEETNPLFHALLTEFKRLTGCPVLVNTSFNVRGEPIVESPADAFRCFMGTNIDVLVVGNCYLRKEAQDPALAADYKVAFEPD